MEYSVLTSEYRSITACRMNLLTIRAIAAYETSRPDFVTMDSGIKGFNGIALSKQIKAMDPTPKIVLVSDYAGLREARGMQS